MTSRVVFSRSAENDLRGLFALAVVYAAARAFWLIDSMRWQWLDSELAGGAVKLVLFVGVGLLAARKDIGLATSPLRGLAFGAIATIPMAAVALAAPARSVLASGLVASVVLAPIAEEILFRGYLLGALRDRAKWHPSVAIAASAILFGLAHSPDVVQRFSPALLVTSAGGAVFAWLYLRLRALWPVIALHGAMNFWWELIRGDRIGVVLTPDVAGAAQLASFALALALAWLSTTSTGAAYSSARVVTTSARNPPNPAPEGY